MYIWRMCEALRVLLDSQFQLSWGTDQAQAFFILISVVFNAPCRVQLLTVLRPTIPWCVDCNSSTGLAATKLGDILVSLHDDFVVQLSRTFSLVGFQGWATETFDIVTSVSFPESSKEEARQWVEAFPASSLFLSWPQKHGDPEESKSSGFSARDRFSFPVGFAQQSESRQLGGGGTEFAGSHHQALQGHESEVL